MVTVGKLSVDTDPGPPKTQIDYYDIVYNSTGVCTSDPTPGPQHRALSRSHHTAITQTNCNIAPARLKPQRNATSDYSAEDGAQAVVEFKLVIARISPALLWKLADDPKSRATHTEIKAPGAITFLRAKACVYGLDPIGSGSDDYFQSLILRRSRVYTVHCTRYHRYTYTV